MRCFHPQCRKLTKFIRLADYFVIYTLVTLSFDRTRDLLHYIENKPDTSQLTLAVKGAGAASKKPRAGGGKEEKLTDVPMFLIETRLEEKALAAAQLSFTPELKDFQH